MKTTALLTALCSVYAASSLSAAVIFSDSVENDGTWVPGGGANYRAGGYPTLLSPGVQDGAGIYVISAQQWVVANIGTTVQAGTYTFTAMIGDFNNASFPSPMHFKLRGDTNHNLDAYETSASRPTPFHGVNPGTPGGWEQWSVTYVIPEGAPVIGQDLDAVVWADTATTGFNAGFDGPATVEFTPVPEPTTTALLGLGGLALILRRRK